MSAIASRTVSLIRSRPVRADRLWSAFFCLVTLFSIGALASVAITTAVQGWPVVHEIGLGSFLFGQSWMPVDFGTGTTFGIFNFICATLIVSALALALSFVVSVGAALFLSCAGSTTVRNIVYPAIDLLAGVPSVVYGFVGLVVVVKLFLAAGHPSGSCVLAAAIVLAVMVIPFMVSSMSDTMTAVKQTYLGASCLLGMSRWYGIYAIVLPASMRMLWPSVMLAFARAMGETMAVMMVVGNANLFPTLLGKSETIASLIALEMGTAAVDSTHMHALFAAGFVLLVIVFTVDVIANLIKNRMHRRTTYSSGASTWILGRVGARLVQAWAYASITLVIGTVVFLFAYVFVQGASCISWDFIFDSPSGAILGTEGGVFPAIAGSIWFSVCALVIAAPLAIGTAIFTTFYCKHRTIAAAIRRIIACTAGAPSIVLGLFAYMLLVNELKLGRCILAGGVALALMIIPFIEVRAEKALMSIPRELIVNARSLGCSTSYVLRTIAIPYCLGELFSSLVLGGCYALGATAPLIFTGGVAYAPMPTSIFDPAMALPLHLYLMLAQGTTVPQVYATAFVLMTLVLFVNLIVTVGAQWGKKRWNQY